jgi:hypothetical protein
MTKLKVYGWTGTRTAAYVDGNSHGQTREIVAAPSAAAVRRLTGLTRTEWEHSGCETGNPSEVETALARPGVVHWAPLNLAGRDDTQWTAVEA